MINTSSSHNVMDRKRQVVAPPLESQEQYFEKNTREAVICKYDDDNGHIMNELEFLNLMMKRKTDPLWMKVQYV